MTNIVKRLRLLENSTRHGPERTTINEAANEIERLREVLKDLLDATDQWVFQENYPLAVDKAKAALKEGE
jgi:hypothetical protein